MTIQYISSDTTNYLFHHIVSSSFFFLIILFSSLYILFFFMIIYYYYHHHLISSSSFCYIIITFHHRITLAFVVSDAWQCERIIIQFRTLEETASRALHVFKKCRIALHAMNLPQISGNLLSYDAGLQMDEGPTEKKKVRRKASDLRRRTPMKKKKKLSPTT